MMRPPGHFKYLRAILSMVLVLFISLLVGGYLLIARQRALLMEEEKEYAKREMDLMSVIMRESLLKHDYATVEGFLAYWGSENGDVVAIEAVAPNGFVMASYERGEPTRYPLEMTKQVRHSARDLVTLKFTKDLTSVENRIRGMFFRNVAVSSVFTFILGVFLWFTFRRTAFRPMEALMREINLLNETLEEKVRNRTRQLVKTNEELEHEIAERRQAEKRLSYSESYLRSIIEAELECVGIIDTEGVLVDVNPAGVAMAEAEEAADLTGKPFDKIMSPEFHDPFRAFREEVLKEGKGELVFEIVGLKGGRRWLEAHAVAFFDERNKRTLVLAVMRDITEKRKLEEQLRHAQKMETISTLAGGISHEFNNILTAIMGYAEFLQEGLPPGDPLRKYADLLQSSAHRAAGLTQSLVAYSRKQIVRLSPEHLSDIVKKVEAHLLRILPENIKLAIRPSPEEAILVVDRAQIELVIMNLAVNAIDAMPRGGVLTLSAGVTYGPKGWDESRRYALIAVADTGIGMDEETRKRIFEPFFTTKDVGEGAGLGLSMVYGIVKKHEGIITLQSAPGQGTTFSVYFPLSEPRGAGKMS